MSRINEYENVVFGFGRFGSGVFSVAFNTQNIPSALYDPYRGVLGFARDLGFVPKRYPWRIVQPGTDPQLIQWAWFRTGADIFNLLPGATKTMWYNDSLGSGLFYYTYYMQNFLNGKLSGIFGLGYFGIAIFAVTPI